MYYVLAFLLGVVAGAVGAIIYYRKNRAQIEASLKEAIKARNELSARIDELLGKKP